MAEVPVVISSSERLNEVIRQAQVRLKDSRQADARIDRARAQNDARLEKATDADRLRQEDLEFRQELELQRQRDLDARIREFDTADAASRDRNLPRGSIVDILA